MGQLDATCAAPPRAVMRPGRREEREARRVPRERVAVAFLANLAAIRARAIDLAILCNDAG
jgi:hypothetical protein